MSDSDSPRRARTLERAYELAASGECEGLRAIKNRLKAEGYEGVREQLFGGSVRKALQALCVGSGAKCSPGLGPEGV